MDVQNKLEEMLTYHVRLKNYYKKIKKVNEVKRHTQFIIAINHTRVELKLIREENEKLKKTMEMGGDEQTE